MAEDDAPIPTLSDPRTIYTIAVDLIKVQDGELKITRIHRLAASRLSELKAVAVLVRNLVLFELGTGSDADTIWSLSIVDRKLMSEDELIPGSCYMDPLEAT